MLISTSPVAACALFFSLFSGSLSAPSSPDFKQLSEIKSVPSGWKQNAQDPSPDAVLRLHLSVTSEKQEDFEDKLVSISTPGHKNYGSHLSRDKLHHLLQPSTKATDSVISWLKKGGAYPSSISHAGENVAFHIKVSDAEKLLNTKFHSYTSKSKKHAIRALQYSVPASVSPYVKMIQPTTRFGSPDAKVALKTDLRPLAKRGFLGSKVNCDEEITPDCLRNLYNMGDFTTTPDPKNTLGISGYLKEYAVQKDLTTFLKIYAPKFANNTFTFVGVKNGTNPQNATQQDSTESSLDVDYGIGLSNAKTIFYGTPGTGPLIPDLVIPKPTDDDTEPYLDQLHYLLSLPDDELPTVLSTSYGEEEQNIPRDYSDAVCHGFAKLGARGVSVIFSSGDSGVGAACMTNDGKNQTRFMANFPGSCPYLTSVGATFRVNPEQGVSFSSGGFSDRYPAPSYQKDAVQTYLREHLAPGKWKGLYNEKGRGIPDVSAQGVNFRVIDKGHDASVSGTSASAPAFAAIVSNLNAIRLKAGKPPLGFLNPFLYSVADKGFNDITHGGSSGCTGEYAGSVRVPYASWNATPGWDPVTGLGTPNFGELAKLVLDA
ncbi:Peptidase S8/S53, subtilisin/kexin/sedolisin [Ascosphaera apis ARSEF 7405]|uniref:tripeptidyl-peptidase II n=1 Tax=Ascosphaera apis ARSEF 7405 TaxID=392613 RepID=A0A162IT59_9EURO|nr:Peptidase S8/S53, subtilisin/kexin/sedolisin [Ascosphaera apis ARSEF 7405]